MPPRHARRSQGSGARRRRSPATRPVSIALLRTSPERRLAGAVILRLAASHLLPRGASACAPTLDAPARDDERERDHASQSGMRWAYSWAQSERISEHLSALKTALVSLTARQRSSCVWFEPSRAHSARGGTSRRSGDAAARDRSAARAE